MGSAWENSEVINNKVVTLDCSTIDLNVTRFSFNGQVVPGERLANLLGVGKNPIITEECGGLITSLSDSSCPQ